MDISIKTDNMERDGPDAVPNEPAVDAVVHVSISNHGLEAYVRIEPPVNGGAAPTLAMLKAALAEGGITCHVDAEMLEALAEKPDYDRNIAVAQGIAPVNGADGTATFLIETGKKNLVPRENEDGIVDFRDLGLVENVAQGQVLCTITPPTEGTPGLSVTGKELLQKKGKPVPSYLGKNTRLNEDGTAILSTIDGQVEFDGRKINVSETFYVRGNVDSSTGNICAASNLTVLGMVFPGFRIEAGRAIDVKGIVENATIKAGGNIRLLSGITGSELYCEGDLKCRFIENCNVLVKGEITAEYILNSQIKCGKTIRTVGKIAKIIGGNCVAGENIEAGTIGSAANVKTRLELGADFTVIRRQQELLTTIPELEAKMKGVNALLTLLRQLEAGNRLTPDKKKLLEQLEPAYEANANLLEEAKRELDEILQLVNRKSRGRIVCRGTIHPGTTVVMGAANLSVSENLNYTALYYSEGIIHKGTAR